LFIFQSNFTIIFFSYKLAPEHPFPFPTQDCYNATKYVLESGFEFGDTSRVVLAGDSAGGNIVAVMTQRLLAEKINLPKLQVLIYPWTQMVKNLKI
jgi:acetyl esterase/lipase